MTQDIKQHFKKTYGREGTEKELKQFEKNRPEKNWTFKPKENK